MGRGPDLVQRTRRSYDEINADNEAWHVWLKLKNSVDHHARHEYNEPFNDWQKARIYLRVVSYAKAEYFRRTGQTVPANLLPPSQS